MTDLIAEMRALLGEGPEVAQTIAAQMGGAGRIKAMLGATVRGIAKGLAIRWPNRERSRGNYVEIRLRSDDTYDMEFFNVASSKPGAAKKSVKLYEGIYADQLVDIFEKQTGWMLRF